MMRRRQQGGLLAMVLLGLLAVSVLATIAYGSYYQIARGTMDTVNRANASALLTQAAYTLASEARDTDADGHAEPLAGQTRLSDGLNDGWAIPATSGATKSDAWGSAFKYCPWDNGSTNNSAGRLAGANPALPGSMQFALVSAGPDKIFNTSCAQAVSGALGDDGVRTMTVAQMNQGVTYLLGDPVANVSALPAAGSPAGMMRVTSDTQITYLWNGSSWLPLGAVAALVAGAAADLDCSAYPPGMLARNAAEDLLMCRASRTWKKVSP
jgi:hypothetical protein